MNEVKIAGTGRSVPDLIVKNDDLSLLVETSDEWISSRTGIKERRITDCENTSFFGLKAAEAALENASINPEEIELIIVSTVTPDYLSPSTACIIQGKIGANKAMCFDVNSGCTGFLYALDIAYRFIQSGKFNNALVIASETLSKVTNWKDRNTCVLFGDGSGAVVLKKSETPSIIQISNHADGYNGSILGIQGITLNNPYIKKEINHEECFIFMSGQDVFKFATKVVVQSIKDILDKCNCNINDIKYIIPHQANSRIIDFCSDRLNVDKNKFFLNIERYGNIASASIPIALSEMVDANMIKTGDKIILVGFGAGLTWGSALIEW